MVGEGEEGSIAKIGHHNEKNRGKFPTVTISQKTLNIHTHTRNSTSPNHYIYYHAVCVIFLFNDKKQTSS